MKKIILMVCGVALACAVNAATVGWSLAGAGSYAGDAYSFFIIGQNGVDTISQITALCAEGKDVSSYAAGSGVVNPSGAANVSNKSSGIDLKVDGTTSYEGFYVLFDSASADKASNYIAVTSEQNAKLIQTPGASAASFTFTAGNQGTYVNTASNWSKVQGSGVPEPTSGLLLLMGMAALALKRKVA